MGDEIAQAVSDVQAGEEMRTILLRKLEEIALEHEASARALREAIARMER